MKMLTWYIGIKTEFKINPGKFGKHFKLYLEPALWDLLMASYADADYENTWDSLEHMCHLFRIASRAVASHFNFDYPLEDDEKVSAHQNHVRSLAKDAKEIY